MRRCDVEGCEKRHFGHGLCNAHYSQIRYREGKGSATCDVTGCNRVVNGRGYCTLHYQRWRKWGDVEERPLLGRPLLGEHPTLSTIHNRLKTSRGSASMHACVDCGGCAAEWSYSNEDPNELIGEDHGNLIAYSLDLSHYAPRCKPCHRQKDKAERERRANERKAA